MSSESPTPERIREWLAAVHSELEALHGRLAPLLAEQKRLQERQALLKSLLESFDDRPTEISPPPASVGSVNSGLRMNEGGSVRHYVVDRAVELLRDAGAPLHINDLHARFLEHGYAVPGAGTPANLTAHLGRSDAIVSPKRGVYALVEQVGRVSRPKAKRRESRTRARKG